MLGRCASRSSLTALSIWLLALLMLVSTAATRAQDANARLPLSAAASTTTSLPTKDRIEQQLAELQSSTRTDEALKSNLSDLYRHALSNLNEIEKFGERLTELTETLKLAPKQTQQLQKSLERQLALDKSKAPPSVPGGLTIDQISQQLNQVMADATVQEIRVSELDKLIDSSQSRPGLVRERLIAIKQALDALDQDTQPTTLAGESSEELAQAKHWVSETQRQALWSEARMLEQELLTQSASEALIKARHELASLNLRELKAKQHVLEEALSERRSQQARAEQIASDRAQRDAEDKDPMVREFIQGNAALTKALGESASRLAGLSDDLSHTEAERKRIEDEYRSAQQRLEAAGLTRSLGQVLFDQRNQMPDLRQYRDTIRERENRIADATLRQIRYREEERHLRDIDRYIGDLALDAPAVDSKAIRAELLEVLQQRRSLLRQIIKSEDDYIRKLGDLNYSAEQVMQVTQSYDDFLAERLLWVRSSTSINLETLKSLPSALGWLVSLDGWREIGRALVERLRHSPLFWLGLALGVLLIWKNPAIRRAIRARAEPLRRVRTDGIQFTLESIGLTLIAATPIAFLSWLIGQQLLLSTEATAYTRAFGAALAQVAFGLYYLRAFRLLCMTGGVAERHFRWKENVLKRLRRDFGVFTLYIVPIAFIVIALHQYNDPVHDDGLGRLLLIATMLGFAVFFARLLNPNHGAISRFLTDHPKGWLHRLRRVWFPAIVGAPLALAVLAIVGYVYTAGILFQSLVYQVWTILALITLHQTIVRWLIVTRRRLAFQAALERQTARRAQQAADSEHHEAGVVTEIFQVEEPEPNLAALDEQTRRLINASVFIGGAFAIWATWSEVLPAFGFLERFALWYHTGIVDGIEQTIPVTIADMGLILLILVVATIAARNLPALLEILLLQSDSVSAGARYTIKTLSSYLITAAAFLLAFSTLGFDWGQVQWLVAALGVGIGFGLQEIVANFISGLIILFERPVRVGDIVTIGDTTGVVTNIRIRATTIRNWDKQELLVPNKEFITGRLLNWTLTDQLNRITIPVGIEYGSDANRALELLAQIASKHERVLKDPAPLISFESFGDNALTLVLRAYMDSLDGRIGVITELHQAIYDTFKAEGIGIAFPQRDVHLYTKAPLDVRLQSPDETPRNSGAGIA